MSLCRKRKIHQSYLEVSSPIKRAKLNDGRSSSVFEKDLTLHMNCNNDNDDRKMKMSKLNLKSAHDQQLQYQCCGNNTMTATFCISNVEKGFLSWLQWVEVEDHTNKTFTVPW
mmetsp:Transcript_46194/g.76832  ORF Transcript_46194/g.76832 Transcript_46194/m.76832 type:complete len:113 (-) Transcript_46194:138-476(-)